MNNVGKTILIAVSLIFAVPAVLMFSAAGSSVLSQVGCIGVKEIQNPLPNENNIDSKSAPYSGHSFFGRRGPQIIERHIGGMDTTQCSVLWKADHETFEVLSKVWAKDKKRAYFNIYSSTSPKVVSFKIDTNTFKLLGEKMAKDKNNVYCIDAVVDGVDAATFELLDFKYSKDKNNIYYYICESNLRMIVEGADLKTFEVLKNDYAKDKNNVYQYSYRENKGIVKGADTNTFKILGDGTYAKDKNNVYYRGHAGRVLIQGADAATFDITKTTLQVNIGGKKIYYDASDKNNLYYERKVVFNKL